MKALGSRGGKARTRAVLGIDDSIAEDLRPKAKAVLEQMLDSSDEGKRLAAARSLYSYQAVRPVDQDRKCTCYSNPGGYCSAVEEHGYRGAHRRGGVDTRELAKVLMEAYGHEPVELLPNPGQILGENGDEAA